MQSRDTVDMEAARKIFDEGLAARKKAKPRWELHRSDSLEFIQAVAKTIGWLEQKVQIRRSPEARLDGTFKDFWVIEPYEEDCECTNIVPPPPNNEV